MRLPKFALFLFLFLLLIHISLVSAQSIPDPLFQITIRAAQTALNTTDSPITWRYSLDRTRSTSLGCPLVAGTDIGTEIVAYNVTLTFASGEINVRVAADGALVVVCDARFISIPTATPIVTITPIGTIAPIGTPGVTPTVSSCILSPNGGLSNVRSEPSTAGGDSTVIAQITLPTPATGRSSDGEWFRISNGWVAGRVVATSGDCASLPIATAENGDQNPMSVPYCTITTNLVGNLITSFNPDFIYGAAFAAGETHLVTSQTMSELGSLVRVLLDSSNSGWIPVTSGALSEGCNAFLAQSPGVPGADLQCYAFINANMQAMTEPNGTTSAFGAELGDRYAIRNRAEMDGEGWLQITTFGRTPDGWVNDRTTPYSEGCENVLMFTNTPRLNAGFRTPYCVAQVNAPTSLVSDPTTSQWVMDATSGEQFLVIGRAYGQIGDWYRVLLRGGSAAWVDATAAVPSAGCDIFLADAPGMPGENLQCSAMINQQISAYGSQDATQPALFSIAAGDRFAVLESSGDSANRWVRIGAFGLTQNAWINTVGVSLSVGCHFDSPPPAPTAECIVQPVNDFVNVRNQPASDGTYNGIVGQLFAPAGVTARNAGGNWYRVDGGWVAAFLVQSSGNCASLPIDS